MVRNKLYTEVQGIKFDLASLFYFVFLTLFISVVIFMSFLKYDFFHDNFILSFFILFLLFLIPSFIFTFLLNIKLYTFLVERTIFLKLSPFGKLKSINFSEIDSLKVKKSSPKIINKYGVFRNEKGKYFYCFSEAKKVIFIRKKDGMEFIVSADDHKKIISYFSNFQLNSCET